MSRLKQGRPFKDGQPKKNAGISLEVSVIEELDRIANEKAIKRSQLVNEIIEEYLSENSNSINNCFNPSDNL
jgi:metal-responsive CopG/Arc/MetJ family transcriptional regulator